MKDEKIDRGYVPPKPPIVPQPTKAPERGPNEAGYVPPRPPEPPKK